MISNKATEDNVMVANNKIYLSSPHMSEEGFEQEYVNEAFASNWIAPVGNNLNQFENEVAEYTNTQSAVALSSGTAAIHLALKAVGVGTGDIVFCQSLTFSATANPIIYENAVPVFIDSDRETWNMSPEALEEAFSLYESRVKAVIVVHLYGLSADMDRIVELCRLYRVPLIEDAAESLGTYYRGKHHSGYTGSFGEYGVFSFNGNKIITTSGGGMLVANHQDKLSKVRFWATQSRDPARHYEHSELGYNYRMSNVVAGIGRGQLKVLNQRIAQKKFIFEFYQQALSSLAGIGADDEIEMMPVNDWNNPNYWLSCLLLRGKVRPLEIILALEADNIESRPLWKPMHLQPFFRDYDFIKASDHAVSDDLFNDGICLPSDTKMTEEDLERVVRVIKGLLK